MFYIYIHMFIHVQKPQVGGELNRSGRMSKRQAGLGKAMEDRDGGPLNVGKQMFNG